MDYVALFPGVSLLQLKTVGKVFYREMPCQQYQSKPVEMVDPNRTRPKNCL